MTSSPKTSTSSMGGFKKIFGFRKRNRAHSLPETIMEAQFATLGATADAKARMQHRNSISTQVPPPAPGTRSHRNSDVTPPPSQQFARRHRNSDVTQPVFQRRHRNSDTNRPLFPPQSMVSKWCYGAAFNSASGEILSCAFVTTNLRRFACNV